ncbi:MAG: LuxR C-terminal-related transcriptional regulator [Polyangiaceae bacterium]
MPPRQLDPIRVVEAAYCLDGSETDWLGGLVDSARSALDRGLGCGAATLTLHSSGQVRFDAFAGLGPSSPASVDDTTSLAQLIQDSSILNMLARTPFAFASVSETVKKLCPERFEQLTGEVAIGPARDVVGLLAQDGEGRALDLFAMSPTITGTSPRQRALWKHIGVHCAAGLRLRRNLSRTPEALLEPDGAVADATGAARERGLRSALRSAVRRRETARGRARSADPERALALWEGLVAGRWSLVDRWECDGKRYVAAIPNAPEVPDPRRLTERERQVTQYAAGGASNKEIAYALGLHVSSVGTTLTIAMRKLGVRRRVELPALCGGSTAEVVELRVGAQRLEVVGARLASTLPGVLTAAEAAVLEGLLRGDTDRHIASSRRTSIRTVQNQVRAIYRKFEVRSRGELASLATAADGGLARSRAPSGAAV